MNFSSQLYRCLEISRLVVLMVCLALVCWSVWLFFQAKQDRLTKSETEIQTQLLQQKLYDAQSYMPKIEEANAIENTNARIAFLNSNLPTYGMISNQLLRYIEPSTGNQLQITDLIFDANTGRLNLTLSAKNFEVIETLQKQLHQTKFQTLNNRLINLAARIVDQRREIINQVSNGYEDNEPISLTLASLEIVISQSTGGNPGQQGKIK